MAKKKTPAPSVLNRVEERRWRAESLAMDAFKESPLFRKMVREAEKSIKDLARKAK